MPQMALIFVGVFTAYLAATGWVTKARGAGDAGMFEIGAFLTAAGVGGALFLLGMAAATSPDGGLQGAPAGPYWAFGAFALFAAALDLKVILRGGLTGRSRLSRHLWRTVLAFILASAAFYLGRLHILALASLVVMAAWLGRLWLGARLTRTWGVRNPSLTAPDAIGAA
jgi:hypothetical protein